VELRLERLERPSDRRQFVGQPLLDRYRAGTLGFTPAHISEFIHRFPPTEEIEVHRGAWNTEHHWGGDFTQWTGSLLQKKGWDEIRNASAYYQKVKRAFDQRHAAAAGSEEVRDTIRRAYDRLLVAETSCNFYWGSRWVSKSFDDLEQVYPLLDVAMEKLGKRESCQHPEPSATAAFQPRNVWHPCSRLQRRSRCARYR